MNIEPKLIELVKNEPMLYDKCKRGYRNTELKTRIWKRISSKVGISENICQKKWKSLRDQFVRERNILSQASGSAPYKRKEWKYYPLLSFLHNHVAAKKTLLNFEMPEKIEDTTEEQYDARSVNSIINDTQPAEDANSFNNSNNEHPSSPSFRPRKKRRRPYRKRSERMEALNKFYKQLLKLNENCPIELYFQNIAKIVKDEQLTNLEFLDLQVRLSTFLKEELSKYKH